MLLCIHLRSLALWVACEMVAGGWVDGWVGGVVGGWQPPEEACMDESCPATTSSGRAGGWFAIWFGSTVMSHHDAGPTLALLPPLCRTSRLRPGLVLLRWPSGSLLPCWCGVRWLPLAAETPGLVLAAETARSLAASMGPRISSVVRCPEPSWHSRHTITTHVQGGRAPGMGLACL